MSRITIRPPAPISVMSRCTAQRFEDIVDRIRTVAPVRHLDETGVRIEGRTRWLHLLCTPLLTVRRIGAGPDDAARDFTLENVRSATCNARHRRDLQTLIDIEKEDGARSMHFRLERARRVAHIARETGRNGPGSRSISSPNP